MLPPEKKRYLHELQQSGASKTTIKKKIRQYIAQAQAMGDNRTFTPNYEINHNDLIFDRKISEGGYGIVYKGRWKHTVVAIKEIKREIIEQDKLEEFKSK